MGWGGAGVSEPTFETVPAGLALLWVTIRARVRVRVKGIPLWRLWVRDSRAERVRVLHTFQRTCASMHTSTHTHPNTLIYGCPPSDYETTLAPRAAAAPPLAPAAVNPGEGDGMSSRGRGIRFRLGLGSRDRGRGLGFGLGFRLGTLVVSWASISRWRAAWVGVRVV